MTDVKVIRHMNTKRKDPLCGSCWLRPGVLPLVLAALQPSVKPLATPSSAIIRCDGQDKCRGYTPLGNTSLPNNVETGKDRKTSIAYFSYEKKQKRTHPAGPRAKASPKGSLFTPKPARKGLKPA